MLRFLIIYLTQPLLAVAGSEAGSLWQTKLGYELSNGPKELFILKGAGHFDLYDNMDYINPTLDKMTEFFNKYI